MIPGPQGGECEAEVAKVLCVLYEDPVEGYPGSYARAAIPRIERYYDGQTTPSPERIDFERELPDAEIVISQPFWPAYLTAERIARAPALKLAVTAGIGSDHVDLEAAVERGMTVAEVT